MSQMFMPLKERMVPRRITKRIPLARLRKDLERYRNMAIEMGASDSAIISAREVLIDERVRAKCAYPRCSNYGTNINCPPYAPDIEFIRKMVSRYRSGILFSLKGKPGDFLAAEGKGSSRGKDETKLLLNRICSEIERCAFYDGYYLAAAFGQGPCKTLWCPDQPCTAIEPGNRCRFPLKARSSMEAAGMDVFGMVAKMGWEIYPLGEKVDPATVPHVLLVGLILIN